MQQYRQTIGGVDRWNFEVIRVGPGPEEIAICDAYLTDGAGFNSSLARLEECGYTAEDLCRLEIVARDIQRHDVGRTLETQHMIAETCQQHPTLVDGSAFLAIRRMACRDD